MNKRILLTIALLIAAATPSFAQWAVIDHANLQNAMLRHAALVRQLQQLQQTYMTTLQQYQMLKYQTQQVQNMDRYRGQFSDWKQLTSANTYGNTGGWIAGANSGGASSVMNGYSQLTASLTKLLNPPNLNRDFTAAQQRYGMVELRDGTNVNSLRTLGDIRARNRELEKQISQLESDSLSSSSDLNTQIAVLNKINASNILLLRSLQDTNKLLVSLVEHVTLESADQRNNSAAAINTSVAAYQTYLRNARAVRGTRISAARPALP